MVFYYNMSYYTEMIYLLCLILSLTAFATDKVTPKLFQKPNTSLSQSALKLVQIISKDKTYKSKEHFVVSGCDKTKMDWVQMAIMQQPKVFDYKFSENCDVEGTFTAKMNEEFPVKLKVRHLSDYKEVETKVLITLNGTTEGILIKFVGTDGVFSSEEEKVTFKSWYTIDGNPILGKEFKKKGEIELMALNLRPIKRIIKLKD